MTTERKAAERAGQGTDPAPSATVVVARARARAIEFLLVERHARTAFGASHVFPGGLVQPGDRAGGSRSSGLSAAAANRCLGLGAGALAYYSAAIRELFEETGVLLACDARGTIPSAAAPFPDERRQLAAGTLSWCRFLERYDLKLAADRLAYIAWWITPAVRRVRFSTRFFLALMPEGQVARHDGGELIDSLWLTAADALAAGQAGRLRLPPPTRATLRALAERAGLDDLKAWARERAASGVPCILPLVETRDGRERILLPGDPGYPGCPGDAGGER